MRFACGFTEEAVARQGMRITIIMDVPDAFAADQEANAEADRRRMGRAIPFPIHEAIRALIEGLPIRVEVRSIEIEWGGKTIRRDY